MGTGLGGRHAESGNLLMMPPRALDRNEWIRISTDLVDVGLEAAQPATARDPDAVKSASASVTSAWNATMGMRRD